MKKIILLALLVVSCFGNDLYKKGCKDILNGNNSVEKLATVSFMQGVKTTVMTSVNDPRIKNYEIDFVKICSNTQNELKTYTEADSSFSLTGNTILNILKNNNLTISDYRELLKY